MTITPRREMRALLITDLEMLRVRTFAFGPGRNMNVKYSFFFIFLGFPAFIIPPAKDAHFAELRLTNTASIVKFLFDFLKISARFIQDIGHFLQYGLYRVYKQTIAQLKDQKYSFCSE